MILYLLVGLLVGTIFGYFIACLMVMSKVSDIEMENMKLKEKLEEK